MRRSVPNDDIRFDNFQAAICVDSERCDCRNRRCNGILMSAGQNQNGNLNSAYLLSKSDAI